MRNFQWCEGPTGSGKTGGFALPLLQLILESKRTSAGRGSIQGQGKINTLILCPTRELAAQESFFVCLCLITFATNVLTEVTIISLRIHKL